MLWGVKWYLWALLAVLIIVAVFAWSKALKASRERRERLRKEAEIWRRDYELRQNYKTLTDEIIENADKNELLHGVAMNIQVALENEQNMDEAFKNLPKEKQFVYTLEYFDEDSKKSLSEFFKNNGEPLLSLASPALSSLGLTDISILVSELYPMYDENSSISIDREKIKICDEKFTAIYNSEELLFKAADYIKQNKEIFLK